MKPPPLAMPPSHHQGRRRRPKPPTSRRIEPIRGLTNVKSLVEVAAVATRRNRRDLEPELSASAGATPRFEPTVGPSLLAKASSRARKNAHPGTAEEETTKTAAAKDASSTVAAPARNQDEPQPPLPAGSCSCTPSLAPQRRRSARRCDDEAGGQKSAPRPAPPPRQPRSEKHPANPSSPQTDAPTTRWTQGRGALIPDGDAAATTAPPPGPQTPNLSTLSTAPRAEPGSPPPPAAETAGGGKRGPRPRRRRTSWVGSASLSPEGSRERERDKGLESWL